MEIDAQLPGWQPFFSTVAGVAATLLGLLFVSLALNPRVLTVKRTTGTSSWITLTFYDFFVVLTVSLFFLVPSFSAPRMTALLGFYGVYALFIVIMDLRAMRRPDAPSTDRSRVLYPLFAGVAGVMLIFAAWLAWRESPALLFAVMAIVFLLLGIGGASCLALLGEIGARPTATADQPGQAQPPEAAADDGRTHGSDQASP